MKDSVISAIIVILFWAVLPILCTAQSLCLRADPAQEASGVSNSTVPPGELDPSECDAPGPGQASPAPERACFDAAFRMPVLRGDETVSMDLHYYLTGVLLAETPLSFADEALKAQAVASRTYALRSYSHRRHDPCAVCANPGCCQGWEDPAAVSPEARARAEAIVAETDGLVIRYQGELIDATFFSCSGGQTETAAAVWGSDLPYLQTVDSPGEENAAHFEDETRIPLSEFQKALAEQDEAVQFPDALGAWVGNIRYTSGGGVDEIELGGRPFRGTWLRRRFGLRSTAFALELTDSEAIFTTKGFGHRVGMSQYGADAMARSGSSFKEILAWYYQGTAVERIS